jgi:hypothetical protein
MSKILTREAFENAIRTRGDRRLDQRGDPSAGHRRRIGVELKPGRLRPASAAACPAWST